MSLYVQVQYAKKNKRNFLVVGARALHTKESIRSFVKKNMSTYPDYYVDNEWTQILYDKLCVLVERNPAARSYLKMAYDRVLKKRYARHQLKRARLALEDNG